MRWRSVLVLVFVVVAAGAAVGCGDGDGRRDDAPTDTEDPSTIDGRDPLDPSDTTATTGTPPTGVRPTVPPDADGFEVEPLEPNDPRPGPGGSPPTTEPPECVPKPGVACIHEDGDPDD
jgi:hypothetical protein